MILVKSLEMTTDEFERLQLKFADTASSVKSMYRMAIFAPRKSWELGADETPVVGSVENEAACHTMVPAPVETIESEGG